MAIALCPLGNSSGRPLHSLIPSFCATIRRAWPPTRSHTIPFARPKQRIDVLFLAMVNSLYAIFFRDVAPFRLRRPSLAICGKLVVWRTTGYAICNRESIALNSSVLQKACPLNWPALPLSGSPTSDSRSPGASAITSRTRSGAGFFGSCGGYEMVVRELFPHRAPFAAKGFTYAFDRWHLYALSSDTKGITQLV